jgi:hypothetical protein
MSSVNPTCPSCKNIVGEVSMRAPKTGKGVAIAFCAQCGCVLGVFWIGAVPEQMVKEWTGRSV